MKYTEKQREDINLSLQKDGVNRLYNAIQKAITTAEIYNVDGIEPSELVRTAIVMESISHIIAAYAFVQRLDVNKLLENVDKSTRERLSYTYQYTRNIR